MRCWILIPIAYVLIGLFSFAYVYDSRDERDYERSPASFFAGVGWPVYWSATGALALTHAARHATDHPRYCQDDDSGLQFTASPDGVCHFKQSTKNSGDGAPNACRMVSPTLMDCSTK